MVAAPPAQGVIPARQHGDWDGDGGSSGIICYSNAVTMSNVTLRWANPTVLVFENGVTLGGTINSGTGGSTLDVLGGAFNVNTGSTMAIVAPTTAPTSITSAYYIPAGVALMQPTSNKTEMQIQFGASSGTLTGYFMLRLPNSICRIAAVTITAAFH